MSHHVLIFSKARMPLGHLRITNDGFVISVYLNEQAVANPGNFVPMVDD